MAKAPIQGTTLRWAREVMQMERDELARTTGTSVDRILAFENGEMPTFRQLGLIATKLDRSLAFFFLPPPEKLDIPSTADFRGQQHEELLPLLTREMRRTEQYRNTVLDLEGHPRSPARVDTITWRNIKQRGQELRAVFGLTDDFIPPKSPSHQVFNLWREILEEHGYLIFQIAKVSLSVFRGLSIYHDELPIILLNGADSPNGKIFTLFHEIAHLSNRKSGLCTLNESVTEESVANAFAANFLMPEKQVRRAIQKLDYDPKELASQVAAQLKVSVIAAGIRLKTLNLITDKDLDDIWEESDKNWAEHRKSQRRKSGGPLPWRTRFRDLGPRYIGTVARALEDGRVDLLDATYLLNARLPMVQQMVDEYYRTGEST